MTANRPLGLDLSDVLARFGATDDKGDGCCRPLDIKRPQKNGYWSVRWNGTSWCLHRLILLHKLGTIDAGLQARHTCGNKWCVNPRHIVAGTIRENMADQYRLGERVMNDSHPQCRLSTNDALAIRNADAATTSSTLARRYGLSRSYVNQIRLGTRRQFIDRELARAT